MASKVIISKGQFDEFWSEVLGDGSDWSIDEWDVNDDYYENAKPGDMLSIGYLNLSWDDWKNDPVPNGYMTAARFRSGSHLSALRAWLAKQEMRHVSVYVPQERYDEFLNFVKQIKGSVQ